MALIVIQIAVGSGLLAPRSVADVTVFSLAVSNKNKFMELRGSCQWRHRLPSPDL